MLASRTFKQSILAAAVAAALPAHAQTAPATASTATSSNTEPKKAEVQALKPVVVTEKAEAQQGRDAVRATTTTSVKGNQALRDVPQSITTVTEKVSTSAILIR
jgi:catecholate siderophore receptor